MLQHTDHCIGTVTDVKASGWCHEAKNCVMQFSHLIVDPALAQSLCDLNIEHWRLTRF